MSAPELSAQERETVERFEAAADAPEALRERVAVALGQHEPQYHDGYLTGEPDFFSCGADDDTGRGCEWTSAPELTGDDYGTQHRRHLADVILAIMRGTR